METTIGSRIAKLRKEKGLKQDQLAEALGVSPQAVSKWENDQSCPDITLLPKLSQLLGISIDALLSGEVPAPVPTYLPENERKAIKDMMLRVEILSNEGDTVHVKLPMQLVQIAIETGMELPQVSGSSAVSSLDFEQIFNMVKAGVMGNLVEITSKDGDTVRVFVE